MKGLADLPAETVVDGELVAIDDSGRPDFNLLQNFRSEASRIHYYVFDLLCCKGRDLTRLPLIERRAVLKSLVAIHDKRIRISDYVEAAPTDLVSAGTRTRTEIGVKRSQDAVRLANLLATEIIERSQQLSDILALDLLKFRINFG